MIFEVFVPLLRCYAYLWCLFYGVFIGVGILVWRSRGAFCFLARHTRLHLLHLSGSPLVYRVGSNGSLFEIFLSRDLVSPYVVSPGNVK